MTSYQRHGPWQLSALHLEGFKAFSEYTTIPLRPLTLLFGANSAGKSTILQALYLLRQSMTADTPFMHLRLRGPRVIRSFGSFEDLLSHDRRGPRSKLTIGVSAVMREAPNDGEQSLVFTSGGPNPKNTDVLRVDRIEIASEHGTVWTCDGSSVGASSRTHSRESEDYTSRRRWTPSLAVEHPLIDELWERRGAIDTVRVEESDDISFSRFKLPTSSNRESFNRELTSALRSFIRPSPSPEVPGLGFYLPISWRLKTEFSGETSRYWGAWSEPDFALAGTLGSLLYIPPIRTVPPRDHFVPISGERLFLAAARKVRSVQAWHAWGPEHGPQEDECRLMENRVNSWLRRLGIGLEIEWQGLFSDSGPTGVMRAASLGCRRLSGDRRERSMHLSDVGFGVSQILPIVVNLLMTERRLVTIEQPEVHVHPALQAELGDCLAEAVVKQGHQVICETHSEHLVLRLQKLVRARKLDPNLVTICCVSKGANGTAEVSEVRLDTDGGMLGSWPGGFFAERLNELL